MLCLGAIRSKTLFASTRWVFLIWNQLVGGSRIETKSVYASSPQWYYVGCRSLELDPVCRRTSNRIRVAQSRSRRVLILIFSINSQHLGLFGYILGQNGRL